MIAMLYLKADLAKLTMLRGRNPETPQPTALVPPSRHVEHHVPAKRLRLTLKRTNLNRVLRTSRSDGGKANPLPPARWREE